MKISIVLFGIFAKVGEADETIPDLTMDIFVQSGLSNQISRLPTTIETGIVNALRTQKEFTRLPFQFTENYLRVARDNFTVNSLSDSILAYLDTQLTNSEMRQVLSWLNSEVGRHVTALEKRATLPEKIKEMRAYSQHLQKEPPSAERMKLIQQLNLVTKASESSLLVKMTSKLAIMLATHKLQNNEEKLSINQMLKQIAKQRPELEKETFPYVINGLLYTYQSVNDEELKQYIKFAHSGIGQKYHLAILGAYNSALIDASADFGKAIAAM
jgi:hypothetical protein